MHTNTHPILGTETIDLIEYKQQLLWEIVQRCHGEVRNRKQKEDFSYLNLRIFLPAVETYWVAPLS